MASSTPDTIFDALVHYCARERRYRKLQQICQQHLAIRYDPQWVFWRAYGLNCEGNVQEAISLASGIVSRKTVAFPVVLALLRYHSRCEVVDQETIDDLQTRLPAERCAADDAALLMAALFQAYVGNFMEARELVQHVTHTVPSQKAFRTKGWIEYLASQSWGVADLQTAKDFVVCIETCSVPFEQALSLSTSELDSHPDSLMGRIKILQMKRQWQQAVEECNLVLELHPWYFPGAIEKAKCLMMSSAWDQAMETARSLAHENASDVDSRILSILHLFCKDGKCSLIVAQIQSFRQVLEKEEPANPMLFLECSLIFRRLCSKSQSVLRETIRMVQRALDLEVGFSARRCATETGDPRNILRSCCVVELAEQKKMLGEVSEAMKLFLQVIESDSGNVKALVGMIECLIAEGNWDEAQQQLEFIREIQSTMSPPARLPFLRALIQRHRQHEVDIAMASLNEALTQHIQVFKISFGYEFFVKLDPDFMLAVAQEYLALPPPTSKQEDTVASVASTVDPETCAATVVTSNLSPFLTEEGEIIGQGLQRGIKVLETLVRFVPALLPPQILLARSKIRLRDYEGASHILQHCLKLDPTNCETNLFLARLAYWQNNAASALQYLDQGLSYHLSLRNQPLYHLVKGQLHFAAGEHEEAIRMLENAANVSGSHPSAASASPQTFQTSSSGTIPLTLKDRVSLFILLSELYARLAKFDEAQRILHDRMAEFKGSTEEGRMLIAKANLAVRKGEPDQAIGLLKEIPSSSPYSLKAKMAMANLYLYKLKDKKAYARCYTEIASNQPTLGNLMLLGEALMVIQEPMDAVATFQQALEKNPSDANVIKRIGKALLQTHDYEKALEYYNEALAKNSTRTDLRCEVANLLRRLGRWEEAIYQLSEGQKTSMQAFAVTQSSAAASAHVECLINLHRVYLEQANAQKTNRDVEAQLVQRATEGLTRARGILQRAIESSKSQDGTGQCLRQLAGNVNYQLGEVYRERHNNIDAAIAMYSDALRYEGVPLDNYFQLAKLYWKKGEKDAAEKQLTSLLKICPSHQESVALKAQMIGSIVKHEGKESAFSSTGCSESISTLLSHFDTVLEQKPPQLAALASVILLLKRLGRLNDVETVLNSKNTEHGPGLRYCRGLYYRWTHKPQTALENFNVARRDPDFREGSLRQIIEIYLNPDDNYSLEAFQQQNKSSQPEYGEQIDGLINELKFYAKNPKDPKIAVYACEALLLSREKSRCQQALQELTHIHANHRDYVPVLLVMAQTLIIMKHQAKARNQLKRIIEIAKKSYDADVADDIERAWLLLADLYITNGKYDLASPLANLAKEHNKSCARACEQLGIMFEKDHAYQDAADQYYDAWVLHGKGSLSVGYRLAFNYLKAKNYVEAINICHNVLAINPDYPKIRKDVLNKARAAIRT